MSGRFDMEGVEKTAAQAQNVMSRLKPSEAAVGGIAMNNMPANVLEAARRNSTSSSGTNAKRAIIMQNKQKLRYRKSNSTASNSGNNNRADRAAASNSPASPKKSADLSNPKALRHTQSTDAMRNQSKDDGSTSFPDVRLSKSEDTGNRHRHRHRQIEAEKRLDKYGFILNMDANGHVYDAAAEIQTDAAEDTPSFAESKRTQRRERTWHGMMMTWEFTKKRRKRLSKQLRKGIPDSQRGRVWSLLGNVQKKISKTSGNSSSSKVLLLTFDEYVRKSLESAGDDVSENVKPLARMRSESLVQSKSFMVTQETIERDIHRTYPRHNMFHEDITAEEESVCESEEEEEDHILLDALNDDEVGSILAELDCKRGADGTDFAPARRKNFHDATGGQAALRRVLRAYSVYDRDVGYCQGMNFIAGMFLTFMSEEEAFWLLVFVMNDSPCRMRGLFGEGMKETHMVLYIAEKLTYQFLPRLAKHMEAQSIHITMYATQWLLTLYTSSFQFDLVTRVWDCFLAEGYKVVYRIMLALLQHAQPILLTLSFEDILAHFREMPKQTDGNEIMEIALKIPLRRKHLAKYEKEYLARQA